MSISTEGFFRSQVCLGHTAEAGLVSTKQQTSHLKTRDNNWNRQAACINGAIIHVLLPELSESGMRLFVALETGSSGWLVYRLGCSLTHTVDFRKEPLTGY